MTIVSHGALIGPLLLVLVGCQPLHEPHAMHTYVAPLGDPGAHTFVGREHTPIWIGDGYRPASARPAKEPRYVGTSYTWPFTLKRQPETFLVVVYLQESVGAANDAADCLPVVLVNGQVAADLANAAVDEFDGMTLRTIEVPRDLLSLEINTLTVQAQRCRRSDGQDDEYGDCVIAGLGAQVR